MLFRQSPDIAGRSVIGPYRGPATSMVGALNSGRAALYGVRLFRQSPDIAGRSVIGPYQSLTVYNGLRRSCATQ